MDIIKGFPSTSQDNYQLNVTNIIKHGARIFGRQEIASRKHDGSMFRYTYHDAYARMQRLANAMGRLGLKVGDRVGVMAWNTHENYEMYFGIPGTGAVMLLLNIRLSPQDLSYVTNHAEARFIFVDETLIPLAEAIAPLCPSVKGYGIITDKPLSDLTTTLDPVYRFEDLLEQAASDYDWPNLDETSAYAACYTTGTTGRPKGVYYSHRDVYLHTMSVIANAEVSMRDCFFQIVPMFHVLGWGSAHAATMVGAKYVLSGMYSLDRLRELGEILVREKVTVSNGAPALLMPMLEFIRQMDAKPDLTGTRLACGATEPPVTMMKDYWEMTGAEIVHSYGATETTPMVTINRIKPWLEDELPEDEKWDLRRKQGYAVLEAAVIGLAHPKWEERPLALVVLRPETQGKVSPEDIRSHLGRTFAKWQLPDQVLFVETLPKTSVGKMDKKVLREEYKDLYLAG